MHPQWNNGGGAANLITYTLAPPSPASEFIRLKVTQN
jgi:hypothetical protein